MVSLIEKKRIKIKYKNKVNIIKKYKKFLWDIEDNKVIVEKFVYRMLKYGKFKDIKWVYKKYPEITRYIVNTYKDLHRGISYWIDRWSNEKNV